MRTILTCAIAISLFALENVSSSVAQDGGREANCRLGADFAGQVARARDAGVDAGAIVDTLSAHAREVKAPSQALAGVVQIVAAVYAAPRLPPRDEAAAYYVACTGGLRWF